jgi:hypothetical protein
VTSDVFRTFLNALPTRDGYCLSCLSEMCSESALARALLPVLVGVGPPTRRISITAQSSPAPPTPPAALRAPRDEKAHARETDGEKLWARQQLSLKEA